MEENVQVGNSTDIFADEVQYREASQGSRFLNFLIDNIFMNYALAQLTGYVVGFLLAKLAPDYMSRVAYEADNLDIFFIGLCVAYFNHIFYYTICEVGFKGYTLGKLITGTRAIRVDGNPLTFKNAILRSLSRLVPFEAFSALGQPCNPWHDRWTKTMVIKAR